MIRSSSSQSVKLFLAESSSSSFSDPQVNGAELKEGAAQFPPHRRPPPEPPDPATAPGQENDETDRRRLQLDQLVGRTTSHPESPTIRPPLRSLSLNSPRESPHRSQIKFLAEFPPCQRPPIRIDSRLQCVPQGSLLPSTPPIPVQASPMLESEVTMPHANSEMVLCNRIQHAQSTQKSWCSINVITYSNTGSIWTAQRQISSSAAKDNTATDS